MSKYNNKSTRIIGALFSNYILKQFSILQNTKTRKHVRNQKTKNMIILKKRILVVFTCFLRVILKNNYTNMENN